jgi:hypothetical protein
MRHAIVILLTVSGLIALSACASKGQAPTAATPMASARPAVTATPTIAASATATPRIEKRTLTRTRTIPYATKRVNDPTLPAGATKVRRHGASGIKTFTYELTFTNGVRTAKKLIKAVVTRAPLTRVIAVGTKQAQQCDPNYSGACVPIASDVDCAGGSGNGPAYVQGPVQVVGTDIYGLDADGDGIGCEDY